MFPTHTHDPDAVLDYQWDWSAWLADGDAIDTATVTPATKTDDDAPLAVDSVTVGDTTVTAWISGGSVACSPYLVTCHIECTSGRADDRTIQLKVKER